MSLALAQLLPEFEMPVSRPELIRTDLAAGHAVPDRIALEAARAEGRRAGRAEAEAELVQAHATEIERLQAEFEAAFAAQAEELARGVAASVPAAIEARGAAIADSLAAELAAILAPIVEARIQKTMAERLATEIRQLLELETAGAITVSGPAEWLAAIGERLDGVAGDVTFREAEKADIEVAFDQTRLKSRFEALSSTLAEALA